MEKMRYMSIFLPEDRSKKYLIFSLSHIFFSLVFHLNIIFGVMMDLDNHFIYKVQPGPCSLFSIYYFYLAVWIKQQPLSITVLHLCNGFLPTQSFFYSHSTSLSLSPFYKPEFASKTSISTQLSFCLLVDRLATFYQPELPI